MVDTAELEQVFSEYFGSPTKHFAGCSTSRAGTICHLVATVIVTRFHSTPRNKKKTVLIEKGEQEKMI
jgi:hypothetical protein